MDELFVKEVEFDSPETGKIYFQMVVKRAGEGRIKVRVNADLWGDNFTREFGNFETFGNEASVQASATLRVRP